MRRITHNEQIKKINFSAQMLRSFFFNSSYNMIKSYRETQED